MTHTNPNPPSQSPRSPVLPPPTQWTMRLEGRWFPREGEPPRTIVFAKGERSFRLPINLAYQLALHAFFLGLLRFASGGETFRLKELAILYATGLLTDFLLVRAKGKDTLRPLTTLAAVNTLYLFFSRNTPLLAATVVAMILAKHWIKRRNGRHLFNPGTLGVFLCGTAALLLPPNIGHVVSVSHEFSKIPHAPLLLMALGSLQLVLSNRLALSLGLILGHSLITVAPGPPLLAVFLFAATDPVTSPNSPVRQFVFGVVGGFVTIALHVLTRFVEATKVLGLLLMSLLVERTQSIPIEDGWSRLMQRHPSVHKALQVMGIPLLLAISWWCEFHSPARNKEVNFHFVNKTTGLALMNHQMDELQHAHLTVHQGNITAVLTYRPQFRKYEFDWGAGGVTWFDPRAAFVFTGMARTPNGTTLSLEPLIEVEKVNARKVGFHSVFDIRVRVDVQSIESPSTASR